MGLFLNVWNSFGLTSDMHGFTRYLTDDVGHLTDAEEFGYYTHVLANPFLGISERGQLISALRRAVSITPVG